MKIAWPEFVKIFGGIFYETEGERLILLAEAAGLTTRGCLSLDWFVRRTLQEDRFELD